MAAEDLQGLDEDMEKDSLILQSSGDNPKDYKIDRASALMCNLVKSILEGDAEVKKIEIKKSKLKCLN